LKLYGIALKNEYAILIKLLRYFIKIIIVFITNIACWVGSWSYI